MLDRVRDYLDPPRRVAAEVRPELHTESIGTLGLRRIGGIVLEEDLRELQGARWYSVVRDMTTNDATIGSIIFAIEYLIRQIPWTVEPLSANQEDIDAADFVQDCLDNMDETWEETLSSLLTFLWWGWSLHEIVYKQRDDGRIGWKVWAGRAQDTLFQWVFDDETGLATAMIQRAYPDFKSRTIPLDKCLQFRTTAAKGNPEGFSILRRSYRAWNAKRRIENLEGIGIERDLAGLPTVRIPSEVIASGGEVYRAYVNLASNVRRDEQEGIVIPSDRDDKGNLLYDISLLSTGGSRQFETSKVIDRYKVDMMMSVMADFLMVGHQETGSFALSSNKTKLFATALGGWSKTIAATINRKAIADLLLLNGMKGQCKLVHGDIESPDLGVLGGFLDSMVKAGAQLFPDDALENRLREYAGLPEIPEDRELEPAVVVEPTDVVDPFEDPAAG